MKEEEIKKEVRESYGRIASQGGSCCFPTVSCCGSGATAEAISRQVGYSLEDIQAVPEGANLGLGCGNPLAMASIQEGETVLDLGSGAGFDCFLAARQVGPAGKVIGVDMTPEMLAKARENARKGDFPNVEFRLGEIENLPAADNSADLIISNCVINLAPDKKRVFREALRVLKPGGRVMISDLVWLREIPKALLESVEAYVACLSGAVKREEYLEALAAAGFERVRVVEENPVPFELFQGDPLGQTLIEQLKLSPEQLQAGIRSVVSVKVEAYKPEPA
ncbi:MAG: arsenite methyltransferase [Deltaproteobacteria bacterium]|nr:arsenite methyltransferase [Deltaproteobacteria bacterium]